MTELMQSSDSAVHSLHADDRISNVLVTASRTAVDAAARCPEPMAARGDAAGSIVISFSVLPDQWLAEREASPDELPAHLEFIAVGEHARSATAGPVEVPGRSVPGRDRNVHVRLVESPGNLTELGVRITESLEALDAAAGLDHVTLCFDSLTALLPYASLKTVVKFLQVLTVQVADADVSAHYHLAPDVHDDKTVAALKTVFDAVVEPSADGEPAIRTR